MRSEQTRDPVTVAAALGIDVASAEQLPDFDPAGEAHPGGATRAPRRGPYLKQAAVDERMDPLATDAAAGVPDRMLARRTGLSTEQVRQWRRRRRVRGRRGRTPAAAVMEYSIQGLGRTDLEPLIHMVASSPVGGAWRAPEYVLRRPLRYDGFVAVIAAAAREFSSLELAEALGFEERDILDALALHDARRSA